MERTPPSQTELPGNRTLYFTRSAEGGFQLDDRRTEPSSTRIMYHSRSAERRIGGWIFGLSDDARSFIVMCDEDGTVRRKVIPVQRILRDNPGLQIDSGIVNTTRTPMPAPETKEMGGALARARGVLRSLFGGGKPPS